MRQPLSWLPLGGWFLVQFVLFFVVWFVVFSTMHPEWYFKDLVRFGMFSEFCEFFGGGWKQRCLEPFEGPNLIFEVPGPPFFNNFRNLFRIPSWNAF